MTRIMDDWGLRYPGVKHVEHVYFYGVPAVSSAWAYQVTGPVLEVTDTKIVVQKGKEKGAEPIA